ncbi:DUF2829 domain-containing protein [Xenorhabdus sp. Vera]|uniref:Thoeris anti-defense Tad2 family protein n=1 Tax=Xenorhabdus koppenhoeferi TaxID=351659 RepID=UPI0019C62415|nr:MW1434 family type I TA system toxin [Xenorhabdus sp. Vera]MBD2812749.1 DUF2829 domain-containing protein [Xenorhabdus sp. Vera]
MSEVNKLDDKKCSFAPEQYQKNVKIDNIAPEGSFPWAIIQVYLNKPVSRSGWASNIYLFPKYDDSGDLIYIQWSDKDGNILPWAPKQEDMVACDWESVKIEDSILSFDLTIGTVQYYNGGNPDYDKIKEWGYSAVSEGGDLSPYGTLTNLQSTIGGGNILGFCLRELPIGTFFDLELDFGIQIQPGLGNKSLEVTVNGSNYNLGSLSHSPITRILYTSDGAKQLGDVLKQNVGKTLHFCFSWS